MERASLKIVGEFESEAAGDHYKLYKDECWHVFKYNGCIYKAVISHVLHHTYAQWTREKPNERAFTATDNNQK